MYYSIDEGAAAYASLVLNPNWQRELKEAKREFQWDKRIEAAISLSWLNMAREYEREIREMQSLGLDFRNKNIFEVFAAAKGWRGKERERRKIGRDFDLPSDKIQRRRVEKLVVAGLIQFAKTYPEIVKEYQEMIRKKIRDL